MFNFKFEKRKLIVLSLVFVLISISYLNYMINKQSLLETTSDFQEYEEKQMSEMNNENSFVDTISHQGPSRNETATSSITTIEDENNIVDSSKNELEDIIAVSNSNIKDSFQSNNLSSANYFLQAKIDIEVEREKTIERFDEIINNDKIDEDSRKSAVSRKLKLIDIMNKEKIIETLIKGKGYEDAVVFITTERVYVTVQTEELAQTDIAKIVDIVSSETKCVMDNIVIQKK